MFFGKKEVKVQEMMMKHVELVDECLGIMTRAVDEYLDGDDDFNETSYKLHETEHEADIVRRKILDLIAAGAFLPFYREGYVKLAVMIDGIANRCVDFSKGMVLERPVFEDELKEGFRRLSTEVRDSFGPIKQMIFNLFEDPSMVDETAEKVSELERKTDSTEWKLLKSVFKSKGIKLAEKLVLRDNISRLADIANKIENTADQTKLIISKENS